MVDIVIQLLTCINVIFRFYIQHINSHPMFSSSVPFGMYFGATLPRDQTGKKVGDEQFEVFLS